MMSRETRKRQPMELRTRLERTMAMMVTRQERLISLVSRGPSRTRASDASPCMARLCYRSPGVQGAILSLTCLLSTDIVSEE